MAQIKQKIFNTFISLKFRDYRYLSFGQFGTSMGMWMDQVARGWLIYEMTGSPFLLGLTGALKAIPMLFLGAFAGVLADRYSRKFQIIAAESMTGILHLALAILIVTGTVEIWHILLSALLAGVAMCFHQPARVVMISDLVDGKHLHNAIALNSFIFNLSRTIGPSIAGILVAVIGVGSSYFVQSFVYLLTILSTSQIKEPPPEQRGIQAGERRASVFHDLMEGLKYIRSDPVIFALLGITIIPSFLGHPYQSLMPIFAKDVLQVGPQGLGLLLSFSGIGAITGALFVSFLSQGQRLGSYMLALAIIFSSVLVFFALSPFFALSLALLIIIGFAHTGYNVLNNTLIQTHSMAQFRGRVIGVYFLDRGMMPLGTFMAGAMAASMGAPFTVGLLGASCAILIGVIAILTPGIRRLR